MRVLKVEGGCPSWNHYESKRTAVAGALSSGHYDIEDTREYTIINSDGNENSIFKDLRTGKYYTSKTALIIGRAGDSNKVSMGETTLIFGISTNQYNKIADAMNKAILSVVENIR